MRTKPLFITTAVIEIGVGVALLASPDLPATLLFGTPLDTPAGLIVARVAGAALVALAIACWRARQDVYNDAATGIISAMLFYNIAAASVLAYAGLGLHLSGIGLWPAAVLHIVMAIWCLACLTIKK